MSLKLLCIFPKIFFQFLKISQKIPQISIEMRRKFIQKIISYFFETSS